MNERFLSTKRGKTTGWTFQSRRSSPSEDLWSNHTGPRKFFATTDDEVQNEHLHDALIVVDASPRLMFATFSRSIIAYLILAAHEHNHRYYG